MTYILEIFFSIVFTSYSGEMTLKKFETEMECIQFFEEIEESLQKQGILIKDIKCTAIKEK